MDIVEQIKEEAKYFMEEGSCHDWDHVERVYNLACYIGKLENADMEILKLAVLLHDIGREEELKSGKKLCHAEIGSIMAGEILKKHGLPESTINRVQHAIACHRFRQGNEPQTIEAKILYDSDKIDNIGAIGIGRAFHFAGAHKGKVHNSPGTNMNEIQDLGIEDTAYREFLVKLVKVKDKMFTKEGKKIAENRHQFMIEFFNQINLEVEGKL